MKRSRSYKTPKPAKKKRKTSGYRSGYSTVARTRGVYGAGEMKYFDAQLGLTPVQSTTDWTGTELDPTQVPVVGINTLFVPTQGAGINQRIGKAVKLHKIRVQGQILLPNQSGDPNSDSACLIRLALVWDKQTNSTQAQGEQVFTPSVLPSAYNAMDSFQNIDNFGRFKVLKNKIINISDPNLAVLDGGGVPQIYTMGKTHHFKWTIKFRKPIEVRFNATNGGTIADIVDNSFHIYANASNVQLGPQIVYNSRCCFKE